MELRATLPFPEVMGGIMITSPQTYPEWLRCFQTLAECATLDRGIADTISNGSFSGSANMMASFQRQLVTTLNTMLDKRMKRFVRNLNLLLENKDWWDLAPLFTKFQKEVNQCMFFTSFHFLEQSYLDELQASFSKQVTAFWNESVRFLQRLCAETGNVELDDSLYFIKRVKLFPQQRR